jgi:hypothetical protein
MRDPAEKEGIMSRPAEKGATVAVLGYVQDDVARSWGAQGQGYAKGNPLELRLDRGADHEIVRIPPESIAGILQGASHGGETSVQVLLREDAQLETVSRTSVSSLLRGISDRSLTFKVPTWNVIYADPQLTAKLTDLASGKLG